MKNGRRNTLALKASGNLRRSLYVERELTEQGWRVATSDLETNEVLIEKIVEQSVSRAEFDTMCRQALELVLA